MNILYLEHYAGSPKMGMEFRPYYLAQEWIKDGHSVRMVAGDYSHLRLLNPAVKDDFEEELIDGIHYAWIKTGKYEGNGIGRAFTMFRFVWKIWKNAEEIARDWKPDVIITSSTYPLDTYAGQRIRKKTGNKAVLIHEVHDMWPITLMELGGMKKHHPFVMLMQMAENSFCRRSDHVVSLPCAARDYFMRHGMEAGKFKSIVNGIVPEEWEHWQALPEEHQKILNQMHEDGKFVICFFGSITKSYAISHLIRAAGELGDQRVAIVIVGEGNQKDELIRETRGREDVFFLPKVSKKAMPALMDNIDCCYVGALRNDMMRFGVCMNKLFDSMMSGKPILYAVEAPNNFITEYQCGISVKAEDIEALAEGIRKMLGLADEERRQMGQNGRNAVLEHFTYEKLAKQFEELFEKGRTGEKQ